MTTESLKIRSHTHKMGGNSNWKITAKYSVNEDYKYKQVKDWINSALYGLINHEYLLKTRTDNFEKWTQNCADFSPTGPAAKSYDERIKAHKKIFATYYSDLISGKVTGFDNGPITTIHSIVITTDEGKTFEVDFKAVYESRNNTEATQR